MLDPMKDEGNPEDWDLNLEYLTKLKLKLMVHSGVPLKTPQDQQQVYHNFYLPAVLVHNLH